MAGVVEDVVGLFEGYLPSELQLEFPVLRILPKVLPGIFQLTVGEDFFARRC